MTHDGPPGMFGEQQTKRRTALELFSGEPAAD
jgi:hypothetical protein